MIDLCRAHTISSYFFLQILIYKHTNYMFAHSMRRALPRASPAPINNLFSLRMLQVASQARSFSVAAKRFPDEPAAPIVKTEFPGPLSKASIAQYGDVSCNKQ